MEDKEINTKEENPKDNTQSEIIADLQDQYGKKFKIVEVFEGGVTVGGKKIPTGYLIECLDDGTKFKYVLHDDGEVDNYYVFMKLGNDYFNNVLKEKLDKIYGEGNYACQVMLSTKEELYSGEDLKKYKYEQDENKQVVVYLGVVTEDFNIEEESAKAAEIYNSIEKVESKRMQIGYLPEIPKDIGIFFNYEIAGVKNSFRSFYADQLKGLTTVSSRKDGMKLKASDIQQLTNTNLKDDLNG
jgi:hypothetical protein